MLRIRGKMRLRNESAPEISTNRDAFRAFCQVVESVLHENREHKKRRGIATQPKPCDPSILLDLTMFF